MAFYNCGTTRAEDGNIIKYPVVLPNGNKLYQEVSINEIAVAIDSPTTLTVAQMPDAIRSLHEWGIVATNLNVTTVEYGQEDYVVGG